MSRDEFSSECISVIIPVYNASKHIMRCLDSILSQSFCDIQIILVDDGSFDNSGKIIDEHLLKTGKIVIAHTTNNGPLSARSTGINISSGLFFTFCDADDYYCTKHSLQYMYDAIVSNACDAVQFNSYIKYRFFRKKRYKYKDKTFDKEEFLIHEYPKFLCSYWDESECTVTVWDKIYRRKLLDFLTIELPEDNIFMGDDLVLNLYLLENCEKFMVVSKPLYCYNTLSGATNRWKEKDLYDLDILKQNQLKVIERQDMCEKKQIFRNCYAELASWLYLHILDGVNRLSSEELVIYLEDVLQLKSFRKARLYYLTQNDENWEAVNLLRQGDAQKYVLTFTQNKETNKSKLTGLIKKIIRK